MNTKEIYKKEIGLEVNGKYVGVETVISAHYVDWLEQQLIIQRVSTFKIMAKITTDTNCEMIKIEDDKGNCLFYGNECDFNRDAKTFKTLFEKLGIKTEIVEKAYEEWE